MPGHYRRSGAIFLRQYRGPAWRRGLSPVLWATQFDVDESRSYCYPLTRSTSCPLYDCLSITTNAFDTALVLRNFGLFSHQTLEKGRNWVRGYTFWLVAGGILVLPGANLPTFSISFSAPTTLVVVALFGRSLLDWLV